MLAAKPEENTTREGAPPPLTVKLRVTAGAGANVVSPAWLAVRLQVPAATSVSVVPLTVQIDGVVEVIVTGRPELAVAANAGGGVPMLWSPGDAKAMVWVAR